MEYRPRSGQAVITSSVHSVNVSSIEPTQGGAPITIIGQKKIGAHTCARMSSLTAINFTDQMRSSMAAGASHRHCGRLRFHKMIQSDCPDGQITKFLSSPICKNISLHLWPKSVH